jgi:hypothetical protein
MISLFSKKSKVTLILMVLFAFLVLDAFAEDLPARAVVVLGNAKLTVPSGSAAQMANNSTTNASSISSASINLSAINNASMNLSANTSMDGSNANSTIASLSSKNKLMDKPASIVPVMDLSRYAEDRLNRSLSGYTNVIYPMAESSGFTATAGSGGGGGCGCGG